MFNRHNFIKDKIKLTSYYTKPSSLRQKQYEAIRAVVIDHQTLDIAAKKFGYKSDKLYTLIRNAAQGKIELFSIVRRGPKGRKTSLEVQDKIISLRKNRLSTIDIQQQLQKQKIELSSRTIERILKDAGFSKLKRRTNKELGRTNRNKIIPSRCEQINFDKLKPFNIDCPAAGAYLFLPYIIESGILNIVKKCNLPKSSSIDSTRACLSILLLKLIGNQRLSHMDKYDHEPALGVFAGLNILPKSTYMNTYSCRTSEQILLTLQEELIKKFMVNFSQLYGGEFINLDFHSIPHYGEDSEMEKVWCGARGKTMKGANTVFAQDSVNNIILYTRSDILRKEECEEVKRFVDYWKKVKGGLSETLVFDCKFTKYSVLEDLNNKGVKFITLRKRHKNLIKEALDIPKENWQRIKIAIPKRKHQNVLIHESKIILTKDKKSFRQFIIKGNGRQQPTFIITNDLVLSSKKVLEVYAKRWHIENKLSELVSFFNLNALSSPLMIRIHFDILWTFIADTLYHRLKRDLRRFENCNAKSIFKKFIDVPGRLVYDGKKFQIKIRKRAYTPILKSVNKLNEPFKIPWLNNRTIEIVWTA